MNCSSPSDGIKHKQWNNYIWPPFTQISKAPPPERVLSGKGALLFLENSPPLIDAISSWWVTLHGHSNPYIGEAIAKQVQQIEQVNPNILVVDSIQTLHTAHIESSPGSVSQIRECTAELIKFAKV